MPPRENVLSFGTLMCSSNMQQKKKKRLGWVSYKPISYYVTQQNITLETSRHWLPRQYSTCLYCTPPACTANTMSSTCHTFSSGHVFQLLVSPANQEPGNIPGGPAVLMTFLPLRTNTTPPIAIFGRVSVTTILSFVFFGTIVCRGEKGCFVGSPRRLLMLVWDN